jgi:hypothetical protein
MSEYNEYVNLARTESMKSSISDLFEGKELSDRKKNSILKSFDSEYNRVKEKEMIIKRKLADKLGYAGEEGSIEKAMKVYDNFRRSN